MCSLFCAFVYSRRDSHLCTFTSHNIEEMETHYTAELSDVNMIRIGRGLLPMADQAYS